MLFDIFSGDSSTTVSLMDDREPIVIDNGSGLSKAGFAGEKAPKEVFLTLVGHLRHRGLSSFTYPKELLCKEFFAGHEASQKRGLLSLRHPVKKGIIDDWCNMEKLWSYTFFERLKVDPSSHPVLLTEGPLNPKENREKTAEIMFETFNVPAMYLANQAALSLYPANRTTGLVVDCGAGGCSAVPIIEGSPFSPAVSQSSVTSDDLSCSLGSIINFEVLTHTNGNYIREVCLAEDIRNKCCYIALDFEEEMEIAKNNPAMIEESYELPNGKILTIASQRFRCAEVLFNPSVSFFNVGESLGIHEKAYNSIVKSDADIRLSLYKNIVLAGGVTLIRGFADRLTKEMTNLAPSNTKVEVVAPPERKYSAWIGGSILTSLDSFDKMLVTKAEYDEAGGTILQQKCM